MANNSKQSSSQPQKSVTSERPRLARNRLFDSALRSAIGLNKQPPSVLAAPDRPPRFNKNPAPQQMARNGAPRAQTGPRLASYRASKPSSKQSTTFSRSESNREPVVHQKSADKPSRTSGYDPRPQSTMPNPSKTERSAASSRKYYREEKNKVAQEVKSFFKKPEPQVTKPTTSVEQAPDTIEALASALKAMPGFCGTVSSSGSSSASQEASPSPKRKEKEVQSEVANLDYR